MADRAEQRRPQRRVIHNSVNRFEFDEAKKPANMAYRWVRKSVAGQEDSENLIDADLNGWTPVPAKRHPELAGRNASPEAEIVRGGLVLMELPKEWHRDSEREDKLAAAEAVETQVARLGLAARQNGAKGIKRAMDQIEMVE